MGQSRRILSPEFTGAPKLADALCLCIELSTKVPPVRQNIFSRKTYTEYKETKRQIINIV